MKSGFFGEVDLNNVDDYYESKTEFNGAQITIDLWFEEKTIDAKLVTNADDFLNDLPKFFASVKEAIDQDYKFGGELVDYIEHHIDELDVAELETLGVDSKDTDANKIETLYQKLHSTRVGIYPMSDDSFGVFDFSIDKKLRDYLIAVSMDKNGQVIDLAMES